MHGPNGSRGGVPAGSDAKNIKYILTGVRSKVPAPLPLCLPEAINFAAITSGSTMCCSLSSRASFWAANAPNACREKRSAGMVEIGLVGKALTIVSFIFLPKIVAKGQPEARGGVWVI